jgi:hypothetical protein
MRPNLLWLVIGIPCAAIIMSLVFAAFALSASYPTVPTDLAPLTRTVISGSE